MAKKCLAYQALTTLATIPGNDKAVEEIWELAQRLRRQAASSWRTGRDLLLLLSPEGFVLDSNGTMEQRMGRPPGWAAGRSIWEWVPDHRRERVRAAVRSVLKSCRPASYLAILPWGPASVTLVPLDYGGRDGVVMLVRFLPCRLWQYAEDVVEVDGELKAD